MCDCRNCKHSYKIWGEYYDGNVDKYKLICLERELFIDDEYITSGPCDLYVDVDGYDSRE